MSAAARKRLALSAKKRWVAAKKAGRNRRLTAIATSTALKKVALAAVPVAYFAARPKPIDSLAVMPFVNAGGDPNTEYLSDGISCCWSSPGA